MVFLENGRFYSSKILKLQGFNRCFDDDRTRYNSAETFRFEENVRKALEMFEKLASRLLNNIDKIYDNAVRKMEAPAGGHLPRGDKPRRRRRFVTRDD